MVYSTTGDVQNNEEDDDSRENDWLRAKMQAHFSHLRTAESRNEQDAQN